MPEPSINLLAVLLAAIINMVLGMLWYSPFMFGKLWMTSIGKTDEELKNNSPGPLYMINTIASLVMAYVLAHFVNYLQATNVVQGAQVGFWIWIGFIVTALIPVYLFEMRPKRLYFIYIGYQLVSLVIMGIILAIWK
ncbi:MAG: DUF1761 domain-containing protein [Ignavibacteriae bacterium]|nr:MAG: DUF1761 domain-containing protein [Ignavibacteriota bacterium]